MRRAKEGGVLRRYLRRRTSKKVPTTPDEGQTPGDPVMCASIGSFMDLGEVDEVDEVDEFDGESLDSSDDLGFDLEHEPLHGDLDMLELHPSDEHWMIQMGHFFIDPVGWFMEVTTPWPTDPEVFMKQIGEAPSSDDGSTATLSEYSVPSVANDTSDDETPQGEANQEIDDKAVNAEFEQFVLERMTQKRSFSPDLLPSTSREV